MRYWQPYGEIDPDAPYINGDPTIGQRGSIPPAESIEHPQREIINLIEDSGGTPAEANLHQVSESVRSHFMNWFTAGGTGNAITITPDPVFTNWTQLVGVPLNILITAANTNVVTLSPNGLSAKSVRRRGLAPLRANDLTAGSIATMMYDGTYVQVLSQTTGNSAPSRGLQVMMGNGLSGGSGNWTVPDGVTEIDIELWGGGGSGSTNNGAQNGAGAGAGAYAFGVFPVTPGTVMSWTVGGGGGFPSPGGSAGINGQTSSIGGLISAGGGTGAPNQTDPGAGSAVATGHDLVLPGGGGGGSNIVSGTSTGGSAARGGPGGTFGQPSAVPGGGGAGALLGAGNNSGAGAAGGIVIRWR